MPIIHRGVRLESVHWKNDGFDVQGWLVKPTKEVTPGKHPMITIVHGGPCRRRRAPAPSRQVDSMAPGFDFGWGCSSTRLFRLLSQPTARFLRTRACLHKRANIRDFGRGDQLYILEGIDAVEKTALVDDLRLGLYGHSYGGWASMWANTQTKRFKAIVAGAGIANWTS